MGLSDEALILSCQRGDAAGWQELVTRYQRLIYTIARRAGLDEEQSAEVFQNVFAALVERLDHIERPALIGGWLATAARYEVWRVRRRARAVVLQDLDTAQLGDWLLDDSPPDEALLRLEEQQRVRAAVEMLDSPCRRLLMRLFYSANPPSYAALADELGVSQGSIGPTRARCLQKLRLLLEASDRVREVNAP